MTMKEEKRLQALTNEIDAIVRHSNELNIPISIAFEVDNQLEMVSNNKVSGTEGFTNIKALHESEGSVADFLLALCKKDKQHPLNNVKSQKKEFDFTITNPQVLVSAH